MKKPFILLAPLFLAASLGVVSAEEPQREVIRPADSAWDDAASLAANRGLSPTAERRQAFQNPGVVNTQPLTQGFEEGTQALSQAGQDTARYLEESSRSALEQTSQTLERMDPTQSYNQQQGYSTQPGYPSQQAYGGRPGYPAGTAAQPTQQRSQPPLTENPRYAPPPSRPEYQPPPYDPIRNPNGYAGDSRGPTLAQPNPGYQQPGLAEPFASENNNLVRSSAPRQPDPIPRQMTNNSSSREDPFDAFPNDQRSYARETSGRERSSFSRRQEELRRRSLEDDFPAMPDRRSASTWDDNFARGQSPNSTADRFPPTRVENTGFAAGGNTTGSDTAVASWNGSGPGSGSNNSTNPNGTLASNQNQAALINAGNNSAWDMDRFLLVVLTAICCYVVIAHLDLRNRYRAALRGAPAGYGNPLSEI